VIAEGVETKAQLDFLVQHECREVQGHYFSPAVPAEEIEELLARALAPA
jgi:diguanylate cyclase